MIYNKNDEWYTPLNEIKKFLDPILLQIKDKNIWFPFDTDISNFCTYANMYDIKYINTHICNGVNGDFFKNNYNCDLIISNPPYSKKYEVLERLINIDKPFCMLMSTGIFNNGKVLELLDNPNISFVFVKKRIKFIGSFNTTPPFNSVWVCYKFKHPKGLI